MALMHFIQDSAVNESLGALLISSYLKQHGHRVELSIVSSLGGIDGMVKEIERVDADLVAFSVMTPQAEHYYELTQAVKRNTSKKVTWGGAHCTFMPDVVKSYGVVDYIVIGEGEEACLEMMDAIDAGKKITGIQNVLVKHGDEWESNPVRKLESNLDLFPPPDRDMFYAKAPALRDLSMKRFLAQRGCPFSCNYCFEPSMRKMYKGKGKWLRQHSVSYVIDEIKAVVKKYSAQSIHFSDDSFNLDRDWCKDFSVSFKREIGLPFTCNVAVPLLDEEIVKALSEAGCSGVIFGYETAVEHIRKDILNKKVSDKQYADAISLLKKYNIKFATNNMVALPTERLADSIATIQKNIDFGADNYRCSVLKAYKGTDIARYMTDNGLAEKEGTYTLKVKDTHGEHAYMEKISYLGSLFLAMPFLMPYAEKIIKSKWSSLLKFTLLFSHYKEARFLNISIFSAIRYFFADSKLLCQGFGKRQKDTYDEG